jgi:3-oxoacyl-[acyl-carrier protein] reductase
MDLHLNGKVALVSGASSGLGYAVALALAAEGAFVSICSRDAKAIQEAARRIAAETHGNIIAVSADVAVAGAIERWCDSTLKRWGRIDLLYAGTGGPRPGSFDVLVEADWLQAFELLVLSVVRLVRAVVPAMRQRHAGSIVLPTSSSVKEPIPQLTLSNVLRSSVAALAKTLAHEFAEHGIRINQLVPGRIDTLRVRQLDELAARRRSVTVEEQQQRSVAEIPLGRYGTADEFARAAVFLLSDAASYITGATLQVDGGKIRSVL